MPKPRKAKHPGPLPHQRRLHSARERSAREELQRSRNLSMVTFSAPNQITVEIAALPAAWDALWGPLRSPFRNSDWRLP